MSDYLTRSFRAQVTTTIDSMMRTTVHEVTQLFEKSIKDYKVELSQKGEEIIRLQVKLQEAEMKLKVKGDMTAEKEQEVQTTSRQISDNCKIDVEEPDDWCAPLGCESLTQEDLPVCPSVRLRPLSIPLWHLPIKMEALGNKSSLLTTYGRKSKKNERGTEMEHMLRAVKPEMSEVPVTPGHSLRGRKASVAGQRNLMKSQARKVGLPTESGSEVETCTTDDKKMFSCKFCHRVFDTGFGLFIHTRSHQRCNCCKKVCPTPSGLRYHQRSCKKFQKMLAKNGTRLPNQTHETQEEQKQTPSSEKVIITKKRSPTSHKDKPLSVPNDDRTFVCNMCPKKFRVKRALKQHATKMHKVQVNHIDTKGELSWTKPLEDFEDIQEGNGFPNKDASQAVNHDDDQHCHKQAEKPSRKPRPRGHGWSRGFICSVCKKVLRTRFLLTRHFRIHKEEKPFECLVSDNCLVPNTLVCKHCGMAFRSHNSHKQHILRIHKIWPHACSFCGKGFCTAGRLKSHYERFHVNANIEVTV